MAKKKTTQNEMKLTQPMAVTRKDIAWMFRSKALADRMIRAGWFRELRPGGRGCSTLYDYESVPEARERLKNGEEPKAM